MNARRVAATVLAALLPASCGGGETSQLSTPQLRAQVSRICRTASARAERIPTPTLASGQGFLTRGMAILNPELRRLRSLTPAHGATATFRTATDGLAAELDLLGRARRALRHGSDPVGTMQGLQRRLTPVEARTDKAWETLGVRDCMDI